MRSISGSRSPSVEPIARSGVALMSLVYEPSAAQSLRGLWTMQSSTSCDARCLPSPSAPGHALADEYPASRFGHAPRVRCALSAIARASAFVALVRRRRAGPRATPQRSLGIVASVTRRHLSPIASFAARRRCHRDRRELGQSRWRRLDVVHGVRAARVRCDRGTGRRA